MCVLTCRLLSILLLKKLNSLLQGWITLQLTRTPGLSRGFMSARSVMGFLSDVYTTAADEVGKIQLIADESVSGREYYFIVKILFCFVILVDCGVCLSFRFKVLFLIFPRKLQRSC